MAVYFEKSQLDDNYGKDLVDSIIKEVLVKNGIWTLDNANASLPSKLYKENIFKLLYKQTNILNNDFFSDSRAAAKRRLLLEFLFAYYLWSNKSIVYKDKIQVSVARTIELYKNLTNNIMIKDLLQTYMFEKIFTETPKKRELCSYLFNTLSSDENKIDFWNTNYFVSKNDSTFLSFRCSCFKTSDNTGIINDMLKIVNQQSFYNFLEISALSAVEGTDFVRFSYTKDKNKIENLKNAFTSSNDKTVQFNVLKSSVNAITRPEIKVIYLNTIISNLAFYSIQQYVELVETVPTQYWLNFTNEKLKTACVKSNNFINFSSDQQQQLLENGVTLSTLDFPQQLIYIKTNYFLAKDVATRQAALRDADLETKLSGEKYGDYVITNEDRVAYLAALGTASLLSTAYPASILYKTAKPISEGNSAAIQNHKIALSKNAIQSETATAAGAYNILVANKIINQAKIRAEQGYFYVDIPLSYKITVNGKKKKWAINSTVIELLTDQQYNINYVYEPVLNGMQQVVKHRFSWPKNASTIDDYAEKTYMGNDNLQHIEKDYYNQDIVNIQNKTIEKQEDDDKKALRQIRIQIMDAAEQGHNILYIENISEANKLILILEGFVVGEASYDIEVISDTITHDPVYGPDGKTILEEGYVENVYEMQTIDGYSISWENKLIENNEEAYDITKQTIQTNEKIELNDILLQISQKANEGISFLQLKSIATDNVLKLTSLYNFKVVRYTDYYEISWDHSEKEEIFIEINGVLNQIANAITNGRKMIITPIKYDNQEYLKTEEEINNENSVINPKAVANADADDTMNVLDTYGFVDRFYVDEKYIIQSNNTVLPIVGETTGVDNDADDVEEIVEAILSEAHDPNKQLELKNRAKHYYCIKWDVPLGSNKNKFKFVQDEDKDDYYISVNDYFFSRNEYSLTAPQNVISHVRAMIEEAIQTGQSSIKINKDLLTDLGARILQLNFNYEITDSDSQYLISWSDSVNGYINNGTANKLYLENRAKLVEQQAKDITAQVAEAAKNGETYLEITEYYPETITTLEGKPYFYNVTTLANKIRVSWEQTKEQRYLIDFKNKIEVTKQEFESKIIPLISEKIFDHFPAIEAGGINDNQMPDDGTIKKNIIDKANSIRVSNIWNTINGSEGITFFGRSTLSSRPKIIRYSKDNMILIGTALDVEAKQINSKEEIFGYQYSLPSEILDNALVVSKNLFTYPEIVAPGYEKVDQFQNYMDLNDNKVIDGLDIFDSGVISHLGLSSFISILDNNLFQYYKNNNYDNYHHMTINNTLIEEVNNKTFPQELSQETNDDDEQKDQELFVIEQKQKEELKLTIINQNSLNNQEDSFYIGWTPKYEIYIYLILKKITNSIKGKVNQTNDIQIGATITVDTYPVSWIASVMRETVISVLKTIYNVKTNIITVNGIKNYQFIWIYDGTDITDPWQHEADLVLKDIAKAIYFNNSTEILNYSLRFPSVSEKKYNNLNNIIEKTDDNTYNLKWNTGINKNTFNSSVANNYNDAIQTVIDYIKSKVETALDNNETSVLIANAVPYSIIDQAYEELKEQILGDTKEYIGGKIQFKSSVDEDTKKQELGITNYMSDYETDYLNSCTLEYLIIAYMKYYVIKQYPIRVGFNTMQFRTIGNPNKPYEDLLNDLITKRARGLISEENYQKSREPIDKILQLYINLDNEIKEIKFIDNLKREITDSTIRDYLYRNKSKIIPLNTSISFLNYYDVLYKKIFANENKDGYFIREKNSNALADPQIIKMLDYILTEIHPFTVIKVKRIPEMDSKNSIQITSAGELKNKDIPASEIAKYYNTMNPNNAVTVYDYKLIWEGNTNPFSLKFGQLILSDEDILKSQKENNIEQETQQQIEAATKTASLWSRNTAYSTAANIWNKTVEAEINTIMLSIQEAANKGLFQVSITSISDDAKKYLQSTFSKNNVDYDLNYVITESGKGIVISWPSIYTKEEEKPENEYIEDEVLEEIG